MQLNLKQLIELELTPNEYVYLKLLYDGVSHDRIVKIFKDDLGKVLAIQYTLVNNGFLRQGTEKGKIILLQKTVSLFKEKVDEVEKFVEDYRMIFHRSNINGVIGKMGNAKACRERLLKFMKEYPEYDKEIILKAVSLYVESERYNSNFKYLQKAHYVISKANDGRIKDSRLAEYCEAVAEGASVDNDDDFTVDA